MFHSYYQLFSSDKITASLLMLTKRYNYYIPKTHQTFLFNTHFFGNMQQVSNVCVFCKDYFTLCPGFPPCVVPLKNARQSVGGEFLNW